MSKTTVVQHSIQSDLFWAKNLPVISLTSNKNNKYAHKLRELGVIQQEEGQRNEPQQKNTQR